MVTSKVEFDLLLLVGNSNLYSKVRKFYLSEFENSRNLVNSKVCPYKLVNRS